MLLQAVSAATKYQKDVTSLFMKFSCPAGAQAFRTRTLFLIPFERPRPGQGLRTFVLRTRLIAACATRARQRKVAGVGIRGSERYNGTSLPTPNATHCRSVEGSHIAAPRTAHGDGASLEALTEQAPSHARSGLRQSQRTCLNRRAAALGLGSYKA